MLMCYSSSRAWSKITLLREVMQSCRSPDHCPATRQLTIITFGFRQFTVLGARHVTIQTRGHIVSGCLEIARAPPWGLALAPGPELTRGVLRACALTRRARRLEVVLTAHGVVAEVRGVVLKTFTLRRLAKIARRTRWRKSGWLPL